MLPLAEKTVVITRPREQAAELKNELERLGARVLLFPTIEIAAPESYDELDKAIMNLSKYDWLIFTSANGAEYFLQRLDANNIEIAELDTLLVCAIGEATAERLRLGQVHIDVIPTNSRAEGVFAALSDYIGGEENFQNIRFLLPRSEIARDFLPLKLQEVGAEVDDVIAYRTILPRSPEIGKLKALLQGEAIDCITFTSSSTFKNLTQIFAGDDLPQLLENVAIACIGEVTAKTVYEHDLKVQIISPEASSHAFARSIANYFLS
jgi:uroporphyrinogen III methyltransferase/synthase